MESLCATFLPIRCEATTVEETLRKEVLQYSVHDLPFELDGTYADVRHENKFDSRHAPLESTQTEIQNGLVYMYGRYESFWIVDAMKDVYLKTEPCDGRVLLVHANVDDDFVFSGWLYEWIENRYNLVDQIGPVKEKKLKDYFQKNHDLYARSFSYGELDDIPQENC